MRLATIRNEDKSTSAVRVDGETGYRLNFADVSDVLRHPDWEVRAREESASTVDITQADFAPVLPQPGKIICVGLNYARHITEMGRDLPEFPTLFAKYPESLVGARDVIVIPPESSSVDWEAELAVVIGRTVRRATADQASQAIAGFTILNDVTMRDWQYRSPMWLQGKTFEDSSPLGPMLVTPDELNGGTKPDLAISSHVDGEMVQEARTNDLVFSPTDLVSYVSTILTLHPGDIIATGTPGGVGHARKPPTYLRPGSVLTTRIEGIGELVNTCIAEQVTQ